MPIIDGVRWEPWPEEGEPWPEDPDVVLYVPMARWAAQGFVPDDDVIARQERIEGITYAEVTAQQQAAEKGGDPAPAPPQETP